MKQKFKGAFPRSRKESDRKECTAKQIQSVSAWKCNDLASGPRMDAPLRRLVAPFRGVTERSARAAFSKSPSNFGLGIPSQIQIVNVFTM